MTIADTEAAVEIKDVSFSYDGENDDHAPLYKDFDLVIGRARVTAIMGASGSGKSTLGKLLGGELASYHGTVTWSQQLASELDHFYIDQDPKKVFFPRQTVRENISYPARKRRHAPDSIDAWVDRLLTDFKLTAVAERFPLFTSGGQQSRLALARVLSWRPQAVILDEYLSSLDVNTRQLVITNLHQIVAKEGTTIVLITHNLTEALKLADRCIILGKKPVSILADIAIDLPHPRDESTPGYQDAENALINILRHGIL
ncbi:MAG TPA: ATP-binding cassette domain-containing protein [Candidatus Paceibacterota bacterium]|nr:ATP-binding cassette domain-containing protein [Candidatus Paceibacterota bacterium]